MWERREGFYSGQGSSHAEQCTIVQPRLLVQCKHCTKDIFIVCPFFILHAFFLSKKCAVWGKMASLSQLKLMWYKKHLLISTLIDKKGNKIWYNNIKTLKTTLFLIEACTEGSLKLYLWFRLDFKWQNYWIVWLANAIDFLYRVLFWIGGFSPVWGGFLCQTIIYRHSI